LDGRLYLGVTSSPFIVVLQPDEPEEAEAFFDTPRTAQTAVGLAFGGADPENGEWTLTTDFEDGAVTFRFALSAALEPWMFGATDQPQRAGPTSDRKRVITVLGAGEEDARLLVFAPVSRDPEISDRPVVGLRASRLDPDLTYRGEEPSPSPSWSEPAAVELLRRLRSEGWPHASIIEYAAAHGGVVSRATVYELAGYEPERMLRGFTRPPRRITRDLIREGRLSKGADWPLLTRYSGGVLASHFVVPGEFINWLA
jgi:hypothetical protein